MRTNTKKKKEKENEISIAQNKYRTTANESDISNEDKVKRQGLWKKLVHLERELTLLGDCVEAANCRYHRSVADKFMKRLENLVHDSKSIERATQSINIELDHLKAQILRVENARGKLEKNAISDDQYVIDLKRANKIATILENRLYTARHRENHFKVNVIRLQYLIGALCIDRIKFNKLWLKIVDRLTLDKKMLIDMTDQAVIAFERGAEFRKRIDIATKNALLAKHEQIDEMTAILRSLYIDKANEKFFRNKMHRIELRQLDAMEMKRRNKFKRHHTNTKNAYECILNKVESKAGQTEIDAIIEEFAKQRREYFAQFCYLNDLLTYVMQMNAIVMDVKQQVVENKSKQIPEKQKKKSKLLLESTYNHAKLENQEKEYKLTTLNELLKRYLKLLTALVDKMKLEPKSAYLISGIENDAVHEHNLRAFLSEMEQRLRQIIGYVYYLDWPKDQDIAELQSSKIVHYIDVINYRLNETVPERLVHQCAECAMDAEVGTHEPQVPLDIADIREEMLEKAITAEIAYRVHNLSQCDLPASRALLAKSMQ